MGLFSNKKEDKDYDLNHKIEEYKDYIQEHKENVMKAFEEYKDDISKLYENINMDHVAEVIANHDQSKYTPEEFEPYRNWFYTLPGEDKDELSYNKAWIHHLHNNDHHWQHWIMLNDDGSFEGIDMDDIALIHLFCDWIGMSYKFHNNPNDYYNERKDKIIMSDYTKHRLEQLLELAKDKKF